jgi:hypothetical protein
VTRGVVLGLTLEQIAARARYLGGQAGAEVLDPHVRSPAAKCPQGFYLLTEHNGGKDPTAPDPFDRWPHGVGADGKPFTAITGDCVGGASWCGGFDRYQPVRFPLYDGWINTNSMLEDAFGARRCFEPCDPQPGAFLVAPTGAPGFEHCGHITTAWKVPADFRYDDIESWRELLTTHVAALTPSPANAVTSAAMWFRARQTETARGAHRAAFVRSIMAA